METLPKMGSVDYFLNHPESNKEITNHREESSDKAQIVLSDFVHPFFHSANMVISLNTCLH